MAVEIYHGPAGSYKTSTVTWFRLINALKDGRLVITNVQGILDIEGIEKALNIKLPVSAAIVRITTGSDKGMMLFRNFYHWLPIGTFLFIDEIQDVYPNDRTFKASDYDYIKPTHWDELLPKSLVDAYNEKHDYVSLNADRTAFVDDLGESLFGDDGRLRYPRTLREAFMRHRHYQWDLVFASPDIKECNGFIRSVGEKAYSHSSKDAIPFPYFKRRPRVLEHPPKENGMTKKKGDITTFRKIPKDVFKIYKSTATGESNKSGVGGTPIDGRVLGAFALVLCFMVFAIYQFSRAESKAAVPSDVSVSNGVKFSSSDVQGVQAVNAKVKETGIKSNISGVERSKMGAIDSRRRVNPADVFKADNHVNLPFNFDSLFLTGVVKQRIRRGLMSYDYLFVAYKDGSEFVLSGDDLLAVGFTLNYKNMCLVELMNKDKLRYIYCEPRRFIAVDVDNRNELPDSTLLNLGD